VEQDKLKKEFENETHAKYKKILLQDGGVVYAPAGSAIAI